MFVCLFLTVTTITATKRKGQQKKKMGRRAESREVEFGVKAEKKKTKNKKPQLFN